MKEANRTVELLIGQLDRCQMVLERQTQKYQHFLQTDFPVLGKNTSSAMILAEYMTDYYTCLETLFFRISQFFENNLSSDRWHTDLLQKMTLNVPGIREQVLSEKTYSLLVEMMKFRHFRRYYFEMEYDWDKLDYLKKKFEELPEAVNADLERFNVFLERLRG
jgi:hypothetical protein